MRLLAALSGGVDSAVAAARAIQSGADVVAVHLRTGVEQDGAAAGGARSCCGADDARDARAIASTLSIPFYVVDVRQSFGRVIDAFERDYVAGRTPSPCVLCNQWVKFGRLVEIAHELGASAVVTGHYARTETTTDGRIRLLRGRDPRKDQSYMLCRLNQDQLRAARFPLGDTIKDDVRDEARELGLGVADKPDSQELCFLPAGGAREYLAKKRANDNRPGVFVDEHGNEVASHDGALGYTMGQRKGLPAVGTPRYVKDVSPSTGVIRMAPREHLMHSEVAGSDVNWIDCDAPKSGSILHGLHARIRHASPPQAGTLHIQGNTVTFRFDDPVFAPTPGQVLVVYREDAVVCGATIEPSAVDTQG